MSDMSEQELRIHTHTGSDGIAHLNIPVGIANQDIDITVSYSVPKPEQQTSNVDHLLGSFNSKDNREPIETKEESIFGQAIVEKLANQGVELP